MVKKQYPFLISIPHGGTEVPEIIRPLLLLDNDELCYYCDPSTRVVFGFEDRIAAYIDTPISRMVVDLNRPPLPLPPRDPDGIIKVRTIDGKNVYRPGLLPDMHLIHHLLKTHYFPYHQRIDELIDRQPVRIAFDCHSMLPFGSVKQKDAGKSRPLICLGNNGDQRGRARKGSIATCSVEWITTLAGVFKEEFSFDREVAINNPFSGGFISNSHFWHKGIPWIQIEINRSLYEPDGSSAHSPKEITDRVIWLQEKIWNVLTTFWNRVQ
ncbi:MAG TPA: N-formylglutamate amidohydrolase [Methanoregula sp.]|nr:N-formylglutamate amidohydrolase [Methanoregula sp.]